MIGSRVRIYLKIDLATDVDAYVGREALDGGITGSTDIPDAAICAGIKVLANNGIIATRLGERRRARAD
jgi:hypothetical protein